MSTAVKTQFYPKLSISQAKDVLLKCFYTEKAMGRRQTPLLLGAPGQGKTAIVFTLATELNRAREDKLQNLIDSNNHKALNVQEAREALKEEKDIYDGLSFSEVPMSRHDLMKFCEKLTVQLVGREWETNSFRLSQTDPTDLKGAISFREYGDIEMTTTCPLSYFPIEGFPESGNGKNQVLFLDELKQATPVIQALATNIMDGRIGDYNLDFDRTFIVAAGNRKEDNAATFDTPTNVTNRILVFEVEANYDDWEKWAMKANISPYVLGYLKTYSHLLNQKTPDANSSPMYATPRSWHTLSCQLVHEGDAWFDDGNYLNRIMAEGTIGIQEALKFYQFATSAFSECNINDIMAGKDVPLPIDSTTEKARAENLYAVAFEGAHRINKMVDLVNHAEYSRAKDVKAKGDVIVKNLGDENVEALNNLYSWFGQPGINVSFRVLLRSYLSNQAKGYFMLAFQTHPRFEKIRKFIVDDKGKIDQNLGAIITKGK